MFTPRGFTAAVLNLLTTAGTWTIVSQQLSSVLFGFVFHMTTFTFNASSFGDSSALLILIWIFCCFF